MTAHSQRQPATDPVHHFVDAVEPPGATQAPVATAFRLRETVWVDYAIEVSGLEGDRWQVDVRVVFPEEARALLVELAWDSHGIVETVVEVGAVYAVESLRSGPTGDTALHRTVFMPLRAFRARLEVVRAAVSDA